MTQRILVRFLRAGVQRHGFERGVVGVSGGLDSAVTLMLAAEALGPDQVLGVALPHADSAPLSMELAVEAAAAAGVRLETVPISAMADAYLEALPRGERLRRGNVLARLRMIILYDLSARDHALVLGTSNKTEMLLGYSTLHGDAACALQPLGDLYKTQVRQLGRHLGVPQRILERPPSADLWAGQTDEDEMGITYAAVDRLLRRLVDDRAAVDQLLEEGFDPALLRRVRGMIRRSQFKRRMPPVAKLSSRTVGLDFRYPRDWDSWDGD